MQAVYGSQAPDKQLVSGTLTIEVATDKELRGRLELSSPETGGTWKAARISTPFAAKVTMRGEGLRNSY